MSKRNYLARKWKSLPKAFRVPFVFIIGWLCIIAAPLLGWIPGPGGTPLFLLGIAILSTEFEWAKRFKDFVLKLLKQFGDWIKKHPFRGTLSLVALTASFVGIGIVVYTQVLGR